MNHILIDYENIQDLDLHLLSGHTVHITLFTGHRQKNLPTDLVKSLASLRAHFDVIETAKEGKNALDFQLAFHAGRLFGNPPDAFIHIVSKDKGYDALAALLKHFNLYCARGDGLDSLAFLQHSPEKQGVDKTDFSSFDLAV